MAREFEHLINPVGQSESMLRISGGGGVAVISEERCLHESDFPDDLSFLPPVVDVVPESEFSDNLLGLDDPVAAEPDVIAEWRFDGH